MKNSLTYVLYNVETTIYKLWITNSLMICKYFITVYLLPNPVDFSVKSLEYAVEEVN